jgi:hypothetical protein
MFTKRIALVLKLICALLFSATAGTQPVNLAEANPNFQIGIYNDISIQSPQNKTYNTENILLNFTAKTVEGYSAYSFFYILDGQSGQTSVKVEDIRVIGQKTISPDNSSYAEYTLWGQAVFPICLMDRTT